MSRRLGVRLLLALIAWIGCLGVAGTLLGAPLAATAVMMLLVAGGAVYLQSRGAREVAEAARQAQSLVSHPSAEPLVLPVPAELEPIFGALVDLKRDATTLHDALERERERQREWTELFSRCVVALQSDLSMSARFSSFLEALHRYAELDAGGYYALHSSDTDVREVAWRGSLPSFPPVALVKGTVARDLAEGKILWLEDLEVTGAVAVLQEFAAHRGFRSIIVVPGMWDGQVVGWLLLFSREARPIEGCLMSVLKALRAPLGRAQHASQCFEQILTRQDRLQAMYDMVTAAGAPAEGPELAARILERVRDLQPFHRGSLLLPEGQDGFLVHSTGAPGDSSAFLGGRLRREGSCAALVLEAHTFRIDADLAVSRAFREDRGLVENGYRSRLVVPMLAGRRPVGCVYLVSRDPEVFSREVAEELYEALQTVALVLDARGRNRSLGRGQEVDLDPASAEKARRLEALGHELLGQLRGMLETTQALGRGDLCTPRNKASEMASQLRGLISRLEGAQEPEGSQDDVESLHLEEVAVEEVVRDASFNVSARLKARRIRFVAEVPADFPRIVADPGHLRSALFHLLEQAAESTPVGGKVVLRTSFLPALAFEHKAAELMPRPVVESIGKGVNVALFSVLDQGPTMDPQQRAQVFGEAAEASGMAEQPLLELQFVKRLVDMHRGEIWMEAGAEGNGNRVTMAFPQYGLDQISFLHYVGRRLGKAREGGVPLSLIGIGFKERRSMRAGLGEERFKQAMKELEAAILRAVRGPADSTRRFHNDELVVVLAEADRAGAARMIERVRARLTHYTFPALKRTSEIVTRVVCYPEDVVRAEDVIARLVEMED